MAVHFRLQLHAIFLLVFVVFHASSCEQEDYWQMKLPKVPMPQAIKDNLFHPKESPGSSIETKEKAATKQPYTAVTWGYDATKEDPDPFTINTNQKKAARMSQPFTVGAWKYNADNVVEKVKEEVEPFTIDTNQKKAARMPQPFTVGAWKYNADNVVEKVKEEVEPFAIDTNQKKAARMAQPFTVGAWKYNADNVVEKVKEEIEPFNIDTNQKKAARMPQPFTVGAWKYNADNVVEKVKEEVEPFTIDPNQKKAARMPQPFTVGAWKYNADNVVEKVKEEVEPFAIDTNQKKAARMAQPFTVGAWKYNADNVVEKVKEEIEPFNIDTNQKKAARMPQPFTVGAWKYNADNVVEKVKEEVEPFTIDTNQKKAARMPQPFTVGAWKYNADNVVEKVKEEVEPFIIDTNQKKAARMPQPFTVGAWKYNADDVVEKVKEVVELFIIDPNAEKIVPAWKHSEGDSKRSIIRKESHNHHQHLMHNNVKSKDAQKEEEDLSSGSVFFVEKSLRLGMKLKHDFQKTPVVPFLPKHIVQSLPFSEDKFTEILNLFSLKFESPEAAGIKETLDICLLRPKVEKENRTCAQSMEDVVDFVVRELGSNDVDLRMMRNDIEVPDGIKDYVITKAKKLVVPDNTAAACHRMSYPYVVYYCHHQKDIGHYDVTLVNPTSGAAIQTTAVCHYDTYAWQPDVPSLRYLGIKPGDAPVCHFSAINDMFWSLKANSKSLDMAQ